MKVKIFKNQIIEFLESLPDEIRVPLSGGDSQLFPKQVIEEIENKTVIGGKYFLQIYKLLVNKKTKNNK